MENLLFNDLIKVFFRARWLFPVAPGVSRWISMYLISMLRQVWDKPHYCHVFNLFKIKNGRKTLKKKLL